MVVRGCEVVAVTAVTGRAHRPSPKSPWSGVRRGGSYVGSLVEYVLAVCSRFFLVTTRDLPQFALQLSK